MSSSFLVSALNYIFSLAELNQKELGDVLKALLTLGSAGLLRRRDWRSLETALRWKINIDNNTKIKIYSVSRIISIQIYKPTVDLMF